MSAVASVHRDIKGACERVGEIDFDARTFRYDEAHLRSSATSPLSLSLPLREESFRETEFRPYFEGLLPEGAARRSLAEELSLREEDYLSLLLRSGLDCIGDVVVNLDAYRSARSFEPLSPDDVRNLAAKPLSLAEASAASRLSLAGTQGKTGLFNEEVRPSCEGWRKPLGGAASTHVLKTESLANLCVVEFLSLACAGKCGVRTAPTTLLELGGPVICSARFDRRLVRGGRGPLVERLHQEDATQALGLLPGSKYAELEPSSAAALAGLLKQRSERPLRDVEALARLMCFNYLIGNCDNHLKNISLLHAPDGRHVALAPAYDLVCTTVFARFSRTMGMRIGNASIIDEVAPSDFAKLAADLGIAPSALKRIGAVMLASAAGALDEAAAGVARSFPVAPYLADDIKEDMAPRMEVLGAFCTV